MAYLPRFGVIIFEVKDWDKDTLVRIDKDSWEICADGRRKNVASPLEQANARLGDRYP